MVKSLTLYPYMSLCNLKLFLVNKYQFKTPLTLDFLVRLGLNFHPMGELRGGVCWAGDIFFVTNGQKRT